MGNRAAVAFTDGHNPKPHSWVYLHWNGGPESVYALWDVMVERNLHCHSASYTTAQFVRLACDLISGDGGLSVGIECFATPTHAANCADDNGAYVFHISTGKCERTVRTYNTNGPTARKLSADEVDRERRLVSKHKYWEGDSIRNTIREFLPPVKKAA